ncbi:MAG: Holliday junction resolvase RuvX [Candidatus Omnitrophica bacterium]|nr:Holliday junction resolvase RuvX [Candidatus Omnitrophota bacterium]
MRILSIDFGTKRIGVAVSDALGITAQGLPTVPHENKNQVFRALAGICAEYRVGEVLIGLPVNMDGSFGPKANEILTLAPELERELKIPVKTWDERLTSRQAGRLMIEQGLSRQKQKDTSDRLAATLLLQSYLESKRSTSGV